MPSRILAAPPPPRSRKASSTIRDSTSPLSELGPDYDAEDVDMVFTPVANGRRLSGDPVTFSALSNANGAYSPASDHQSPEAEVEVDSEDESDEEEDEEDVPVVHVEVRLEPDSPIRTDLIVLNIPSIVRSQLKWILKGQEFGRELWEDTPILRDNVERIFFAESGSSERIVADDAHFEVHVYKTSDEGTEIQGGMEEDNEDDRTPAASVSTLPSAEIEGLWENLIYDADIKQRLLSYMDTSLLFAEHSIDRNVISSNRLALLYGPAGTGKTSLCRALAHKLAIRHANGRYRSGTKLIEINSHSLFSKWFSESGKLVQKLFDQVHDYLSDPGCLVVVMIDEVESIAASRAGAMSGTEPGDAVRVVNAILTQLDRLKAFPNVLVLATSNLAGGIDAAFIDRADIKQYIDLPPPEAVYWILQTTLKELAKGKLREERLAPHGDRILPWNEVSGAALTRNDSRTDERVRLASVELRKIAIRCHELKLSGRFLRRLPIRAHMMLAGKRSARLAEWMNAMSRAVEDEARTNGHIARAEGKRGHQE